MNRRKFLAGVSTIPALAIPIAANSTDRFCTVVSHETCQCEACLRDGLHWSDCAVHNRPAWPIGPCDCGP